MDIGGAGKHGLGAGCPQPDRQPLAGLRLGRESPTLRSSDPSTAVVIPEEGGYPIYKHTSIRPSPLSDPGGWAPASAGDTEEESPESRAPGRKRKRLLSRQSL